MEIKINGEKVKPEKGKTILEVSREIGVDIPTLCYDSSLGTYGACRLCLVKLRDRDEFVTACTTPVEDGMDIVTHSEELQEVREEILHLILAEHEENCRVCEASGDCRIQELAYEFGISESKYELENKDYEIFDDNPFIELDPNKCVLCGKCIRTCEEIHGTDSLTILDKGFQEKLGSSSGSDEDLDYSDCRYCGSCVEACPTGALTYKPSKNKGRNYELNEEQTTCPFCSVGCQLELKVKGDEIVQVGSVGEEGTPNPKGETCLRGRFGYEFVDHPDRITKPLIKRGDEFEEVSWETALHFIAENIQRIKNEFGEDSFAGIGSGKCTNEANYLFQKFMRAVLKTNNIDHSSRIHHSPTIEALTKTFGYGAMTNSIKGVDKADTIFVIGSNTTENHPVIGDRIKKAVKNGANLIVADPRSTELSEIADVSINHQPGTDLPLINAITHIIIKEGLHDLEFISGNMENFRRFKESIEKYDPSTAQNITDVPAEKIVEAARYYGNVERSYIVYGMGLTQHRNGTDNIYSLSNLALLTNNIGKEGTGINPLRGLNNSQGACDNGVLPNYYPGYQSIKNKEAKKELETQWKTELPEKEGLTTVEIYEEIINNEIKSLYIMGENPILSEPNQEKVEKALKNLRFLITQDIFLTKSAKHADVVLPAASFAEKQGTFTNTERKIQKIKKSINPPGQAKPDWKIIKEISNKLGYKMNYQNPEEIMEEIAKTNPTYRNITHEKLGKKGIQWPYNKETGKGTQYLYKNGFKNQEPELKITKYESPAEKFDKEHKYILITGRSQYQPHTGTMSKRSNPIEKKEPEPYVEINEKDAKELKINEQDQIKISTKNHEIKAKAKINNKVQPGQIFMPLNLIKNETNKLTDKKHDPKSKIPELKVTAVKAEKT